MADAEPNNMVLLETINQLFSVKGPQANLVLSLINSDNDNTLRNSVTNYLNDGLHRKLKSKQFLSKISIPEQLTPEESSRLQETYRELDITLTSKVHNDHAYAAASRKCERVILINKIGVNLYTAPDKIQVKEVGGDIVQSTIKGERGLHCCSPILGAYDGTRITNRLHNARIHLSGIVKTKHEKDVLTDYLKNALYGTHTRHFCFDKSQNCKVKAPVLLSLHSVYDMSMRDFADSMDIANATIAFGTFIFSPMIFTYDSGIIPWINADFRIIRDSNGIRKTIHFGFKGCSGFNYSHDYNQYISFVTRSCFVSSAGNQFTIELLENRDGIQFFRVSRIAVALGSTMTHRVYLTHLNDKYIVRFPFPKYHDKLWSFIRGGNDSYLNLHLNNSFWKSLPDTTQWIYHVVDKDVIDKTCAYVLGATEEKFKPEQIVSYLRSITTREIMFSSVMTRRDLPPVDALMAIGNAIYITMYHCKYVIGKTLQQAIINTNSLRNSHRPSDVLKEFRTPGFFQRLIDFMVGKSNDKSFDPMFFILNPSEYIEFKSNLMGSHVVLDNSAAYTYVERDVTVCSELLGLSEMNVTEIKGVSLMDPVHFPHAANHSSKFCVTCVMKNLTLPFTVLDGQSNCNEVGVEPNNYIVEVIPEAAEVTAPETSVINDEEDEDENQSTISTISEYFDTKSIVEPEPYFGMEPIVDSGFSDDILSELDRLLTTTKSEPVKEIDVDSPPPSLLITHKAIVSTLSDKQLQMWVEYDNLRADRDKLSSHLDEVTNFEVVKNKFYPTLRVGAVTKLCALKSYFHSFGGKDVLEVGAAPGSWTKQIIEELPNSLIALTRDEPVDLKMRPDVLNLIEKNPNTRLVYCDANDYLKTDDKKYDIIASDMATQKLSYYYQSVQQSNLVSGVLSAYKNLKPGGLLICKIYDLTLDIVRNIIEMADKFASVDLVKPYGSCVTNSEQYLVFLNFSGNFIKSDCNDVLVKIIDQAKAHINNQVVHLTNLINFGFEINTDSSDPQSTNNLPEEPKPSNVGGLEISALNKLDVHDIEIYPRRQARLTKDGLLDVDGSSNSCLIYSLFENRWVDSLSIRKLLRESIKPSPGTDLWVETSPGEMAGTALVEAFAQHYGVHVVIRVKNQEMTIKFGESPRPFRVITVELDEEQHHYFYKPTCKQSEIIDFPKYLPFQPLNIVGFITKLNTHMKFVELQSIQDLKIAKSGVYLYNNLSKHCALHSACGNNGILRYAEIVNNSENLIHLILFFEEQNFSPKFMNERYYSKFPNLAFRYIDCAYPGYFAAVIHPTSEQNRKYDAVSDYNDFKNHKCYSGHNTFINPTGNSIYTCLESDTLVHYNSNQLCPSLLVNLKKGEPDDAILYFSNRTRIDLIGVGEGTICDNIIEVSQKLVRHLGFFPDTKLSIQLNTDFSNVDILIKALQNITFSLHVNVGCTAVARVNLPLKFEADNTEIARRRNAMTEAYSIWFYERDVVVKQLAAIHSVFHNAVIQKFPLPKKTDTSAAFFDVVRGTFLLGARIKGPYQWGYDGSKLVNTQELFTKSGGISAKGLDSLRRQGYEYLAFNSSSKLLHGISLTHDFDLDQVPKLPLIPVVLVEGVPGAGKTTYILDQNVNNQNNLILTVTKEAQIDMTERAVARGLKLSKQRIRTVDSYLLSKSNIGKVEDVWIDEALLIHCGVWMWIVEKSKCKRLNVVGDRAQIPYINRSGLSLGYSRPQNWELERKVLPVNHRNPLDIVCWLNTSRRYDFTVSGTSTVQRSVKYNKISGIGAIKDHKKKYLTFTQADKALLETLKFNVNTVHEYQGNQADDIVLVRLTVKEADKLYKSKSHILVALTRHRKSFEYLTVTEDTTTEILKSIMSYSIDQIKASKFGVGGAEKQRFINPDSALALYRENKDISRILLKNECSGYVSWNYGIKYNYEIPLHTISVPEVPTITPLQDFIDRIYPGASTEFREHDHDLFEHNGQPMEMEGVTTSLSFPSYKPYDRLQSVLRTTIQYPLHQSQKISLKAFFERNGNVPELQGLISAADEAQLLLKHFKRLVPDMDRVSNKPIYPDFPGVVDWLSRQPPAVKKIINSEELFIDQNFTTYDFIIKTLPKIDLDPGAEFRYKSPQTIAYQSKTINSVFCPVLKELTNRIEYHLLDNVILYNGMSPEEFAAHFTTIFPANRYRQMSDFMEIDFSKYDKSQGLVILIFEALLMEFSGVPPKYIALWLLMHVSTFLIDSLNKFTAEVEYQRKSGDPGTWRFNTVVQLAILNYVFRLSPLLKSNKCVAVFSGDDSLIFHAPDTIYNVDFKISQLMYIYNLEAKLMQYKVPYFCSKFLILSNDEWIFVPDTVKLIIKLGRNDIVDTVHAECYRVSFLDNLNYYKNPYHWTAISAAINDRYKIFGEHDCIFTALLSLADSPEKFNAIYKPVVGHRYGKFFGNSRPNLDI